MGFFKRRKVKKFAEKVAEKESSIFVFGSDIFAEILVEKLVELGAKDKVALISNNNMLWIEELEEEITILVEERLEEYNKPNLYKTVGFEKAEKIIILHSDPKLIQNILSNVKTGEETKVILLSQHSPPFVHYLSRSRPGQILIVDDLENIVSQLYELLELELVKPPVIDVPAPKGMIGLLADVFNIPGIDMIKIIRNEEYLPLENTIQQGDRFLIYLTDGENSIKNFITFSEIISAKGQSVEKIKPYLYTAEEIDKQYQPPDSLTFWEEKKESTSVESTVESTEESSVESTVESTEESSVESTVESTEYSSDDQ
ncbi:MAG: hypothetical protein ACXAEU_25345 [Candidatus Hodarchaeales archaeon]|jgi:hypothetical protein